MRGSASARWFLPLDSTSYAGVGAALEDDVEKLYVSAAASSARHQSATNYFTVDLTELKELSQELAELFSLTLPVSLKKQSH
jgi:hypothetical protein